MTTPTPEQRRRSAATIRRWAMKPLRGALAVVAAASITVSGCAKPPQGAPLPAPPTPYSSFDTATNVVIVYARLDGKSHYEPDATHRFDQPRWVFRFVVADTRTSVWVSPEIYGRFKVGDWVSLRCAPGDLCEVNAR